ncbi:MAG: family 43 glycosylhydrolase [Vicinamibacterales bacterium]|nr:family 43 glycosylhydrolase [Vicinamibacterales bacterium]
MPSASKWARGVEGQRKGDLGNGRFLNPIVAGDHPDPTILKDGADYYMTFSSFTARPGLVIWHSRDLVNWAPLGPVLPDPAGSVLACDLVKHAGRYYIYMPSGGIHVIYADNIRGPWSKPIPLNVGGIDPGHIVGEDGKRYLFLSAGNRVALTDDGLATAGMVEKVYDGWKYPTDWVVEGFSLESPKLMRRGDYFYLVCAEGGTYGPPTSHMATVARSKSIHGPWENSPHNPLVHTYSATEPWWSRGHGTLVEGPTGDWWLVYHAYENGFRTLGRQVLLEPITWTPDGWPKALGGDAGKPMLKPRGGQAGPHGFPLSDDFTENRLGLQWAFAAPEPSENMRAKYASGTLTITGKGTSPTNCSPLSCIVGDQAYEVSVEIELDPAAPGSIGGLLLLSNPNLYLGTAHDGARLLIYRSGQPGRGNGAGRGGQPVAPTVRRIFLKIQNDRHIVSFYNSPDGMNWARQDIGIEASSYTRNGGGGESLRVALFAAGPGEIKFRQFRYRAL